MLLTLLFPLLPLLLPVSLGDLSTMMTEKGFFKRLLMAPERCWLAVVMSCKRCFAVLRQCGRSPFGSIESLYAMSSFDSGISIWLATITWNVAYEMSDGNLRLSNAPPTGT